MADDPVPTVSAVVSKHVEQTVAGAALSQMSMKRKWHCIEKHHIIRCRNVTYHDESLIVYYKWHVENEK